MKCRIVRNQDDYKYVSSLYNPKNTKFLLFKKMTAKKIEKMANKNFRYMYIVELGNKKLGSFSLRRMSGKKEFSFGMVIDYSKQGLGYGQKALGLIEREAKKLGCKKLILEVDAKNLPAIHIYKKARFKLKSNMIAMCKSIK
ncbi:MAG: GNAT family N-acetyltransferase [Patescibacteria group bacterium]|nr:GNAT family N-acetyltransferase [Patescibacteria group bacterium]